MIEARSSVRIGVAGSVLLAMWLPLVVASGLALHAIEHGASSASTADVAALASHGHSHPVWTPPHDHDATAPSAAFALATPVSTAVSFADIAPQAASVVPPAPLPRARGSGGDLLLRLSCVLLL